MPDEITDLQAQWDKSAKEVEEATQFRTELAKQIEDHTVRFYMQNLDFITDKIVNNEKIKCHVDASKSTGKTLILKIELG